MLKLIQMVRLFVLLATPLCQQVRHAMPNSSNRMWWEILEVGCCLYQLIDVREGIYSWEAMVASRAVVSTLAPGIFAQNMQLFVVAVLPSTASIGRLCDNFCVVVASLSETSLVGTHVSSIASQLEIVMHSSTFTAGNGALGFCMAAITYGEVWRLMPSLPSSVRATIHALLTRLCPGCGHD